MDRQEIDALVKELKKQGHYAIQHNKPETLHFIIKMIKNLRKMQK